MIESKEPVQQQIELPMNHPSGEGIFVPDWFWLGVIVPIVIAWIVNRRNHNNKNKT